MQVTRKSMISGIEHTLDLDITAEQLAAYENHELLLQEAFPQLAPPLREFIKAGITPEEWLASVVGPPDEDEESPTAKASIPFTRSQAKSIVAILMDPGLDLSSYISEEDAVAILEMFRNAIWED